MRGSVKNVTIAYFFKNLSQIKAIKNSRKKEHSLSMRLVWNITYILAYIYNKTKEVDKILKSHQQKLEEAS